MKRNDTEIKTKGSSDPRLLVSLMRLPFPLGHVLDKGETGCSVAVSDDTTSNFPLDKGRPKIASGPTG